MVERFDARFDHARRYFTKGIELAQNTQSRQVMGEMYNALGLIALHRAHFREATDWFNRSVTVAREVGDVWIVTVALHNLGVTHSCLGNYVEARRHTQETMDIDRAMGDRLGVAFHASHMGFIHLNAGNMVAAKTSFDECEAIAQEIGDTQVLTIVLRGRGLYHLLAEDYDKSHECFLRSVQKSEEALFKPGITAALAEIGWPLMLMGEHEKAAQYFDEGLALSHQISDRWSRGEIFSGQSQLAIRAGNKAEAAQKIIETIELSRLMTTPVLLLEAIVNAAALFADEMPARSLTWLCMVGAQHSTRTVTHKLINDLRPRLLKQVSPYEVSSAEKRAKALEVDALADKVIVLCRQNLTT
jgi:tetratricopeptide (TPR) repeat protein